MDITLFRSIIVLCGTDNIPWIIVMDLQYGLFLGMIEFVKLVCSLVSNLLAFIGLGSANA